MTDSTPVVVDASFAPVLAALHMESFPPSEQWDVLAFTALFATPGTFGLLIAQDGEPAGFVLARQVMDEAEILTLAVRPVCRRHGLGRCLVRALQARLVALGVTRLFLEVSTRNASARALYADADFCVAGTRRRYYPDGSDANVMVWSASA